MHAGLRFKPFSQFTFWIAVLGSVSLFFIPAFIIRPFKYQSSRALLLAMELKRFAPLMTLVFAIAGLAIALALWGRSSILRRVLLVLGIVLAGGSAVMSRLNYFEWMFHPIVTPGFTSASNAKLDDGEMVMSVRYGNDARAYPILQMAYHHVFNDEVGGIPIVVTY